jgi:hypothetical protein
MGLFGRRRQGSPPAPRAEESSFAADARALGWEATDESSFVDPMYRAVYESARVLYGQAPEDTIDTVHSYRTHFHDAFRTSVAGRRVLVANGVQNIVPNLVGGTGELRFFSVCVVELPSVYAVTAIQPRRLQHRAHLMPEIATGNAEFDHAYRVNAGPLGEAVVPPEMQRLILALDDWAFRSDEGWFVCTQ